MSENAVVHSTFSLERTYDASPGRVFAAWARPERKARWFGGPGSHLELDFRVGGHESTGGTSPDGAVLRWASIYHDIVPERRIVFSSTLSVGPQVATVSITTVEFWADGTRTRLMLTEQGTFLDGLEQPAWREEGTGQQLDALATELKAGEGSG
jgi:uncharacterized protein YndB with AHSA1/START domain